MAESTGPSPTSSEPCEVQEEQSVGVKNTPEVKTSKGVAEPSGDGNVGGKKQIKPKMKVSKTQNPYLDTELAAIRMLTKRQRVTQSLTTKKVSQRKEPVALTYGAVSVTDTVRQLSPSTFQAGAVKQPTEDHIDPEAETVNQCDSWGGGKFKLPPLMQFRQRYALASMRCLYRHDNRRKLGLGQAAGSPKSGSLVFEMGGGSLLTYTGVQMPSREKEAEHLRRLAVKDVSKVPENQRVISRVVMEKCGLTASFQWSAGGQRCHGFMW